MFISVTGITFFPEGKNSSVAGHYHMSRVMPSRSRVVPEPLLCHLSAVIVSKL